ncbi:transposase [Thorsellia kenyensis]|uniref:Transposase n=1 Tax=Thorsellia kenyensis TaxID=1549888 RepID=A0ABV6CB90_9GAMM
MPQQKNEFVKLIVEDGYSVKQVMDISGACQTAVLRWKKQYLSEKEGQVIEGKVPLNEDKREIYQLKK